MSACRLLISPRGMRTCPDVRIKATTPTTTAGVSWTHPALDGLATGSTCATGGKRTDLVAETRCLDCVAMGRGSQGRRWAQHTKALRNPRATLGRRHDSVSLSRAERWLTDKERVEYFTSRSCEIPARLVAAPLALLQVIKRSHYVTRGCRHIVTLAASQSHVRAQPNDCCSYSFRRDARAAGGRVAVDLNAAAIDQDQRAKHGRRLRGQWPGDAWMHRSTFDALPSWSRS
jgi:hypothetical protein